MKKFKSIVITFLSLFLILFLALAIHWTYRSFGRVNLDEIAIVISNGMGDGADAGIFWSFFRRAVLRGLMWASIATLVCAIFAKKRFVKYIAYAGCLLYLVFILFTNNIQFGSFFNTNKSNFYETEYVDPETTNIKWDGKRNVLFIALESIEKTFADDRYFKKSLTPGITKLERENKSFENYESMSGLSHTIAAITGFTTGLPLFYTSFRNIEKMTGIKNGIGTIMVNNGYQTWSMFPATGRFSRKESFMYRMGFQHVIDGEKIYAQLKTPTNDRPFGGVDDGVFFEWSKPVIQDIIKSGKPYFLFMETLNTHLHGVFTDYCRAQGFRQKTMYDVIECDDKIIHDFVTWFKKADPSAVIVLINDHSQHKPIPELKNVSFRPLANVFINTDIFDGADMTRPVSAMDFFPTVIEAAGGKIDGCRLGLGVSLSKRCNKTKTLRERFDKPQLEQLMEQNNDLYYKLATGKDKK